VFNHFYSGYIKFIPVSLVFLKLLTISKVSQIFTVMSNQKTWSRKFKSTAELSGRTGSGWPVSSPIPVPHISNYLYSARDLTNDQNGQREATRFMHRPLYRYDEFQIGSRLSRLEQSIEELLKKMELMSQTQSCSESMGSINNLNFKGSIAGSNSKSKRRRERRLRLESKLRLEEAGFYSPSIMLKDSPIGSEIPIQKNKDCLYGRNILKVEQSLNNLSSQSLVKNISQDGQKNFCHPNITDMLFDLNINCFPKNTTWDIKYNYLLNDINIMYSTELDKTICDISVINGKLVKSFDMLEADDVVLSNNYVTDDFVLEENIDLEYNDYIQNRLGFSTEEPWFDDDYLQYKEDRLVDKNTSPIEKQLLEDLTEKERWGRMIKKHQENLEKDGWDTISLDTFDEQPNKSKDNKTSKVGVKYVVDKVEDVQLVDTLEQEERSCKFIEQFKRVRKLCGKNREVTVKDWLKNKNMLQKEGIDINIPSRLSMDKKWDVYANEEGIHCRLVDINTITGQFPGPSQIGSAADPNESRPVKKFRLSKMAEIKGLVYVDYELYTHLKIFLLAQGVSSMTHAKMHRQAVTFLKQYRYQNIEPSLLFEILHWTVLAAMIPTKNEMRGVKILGNSNIFNDIKRLARFRRKGLVTKTSCFGLCTKELSLDID
jgi:hypothetical protein